MKHDFRTYLILAVVFLLSIGGCFAVPANDLIKAVVASPGIISLLAALFQLIRDQAAFERTLEIQQKQLQFALGAASHMANTAFDKHVEFCEEYMAELQNSVRTLWREGETPEALSHAGSLFKIREKHAVWLTDEINENLEKFEAALRKLGAESHFARTTANDERYAERRSRSITGSLELFNTILGIDKAQDLHEEYAVEKIKIKVRKILGVEELTTLRKHLVQEASQVIKSGS